MDNLEVDEYMDVVTTYRCKFCEYSSEQAKDIGLHVKTAHIKPRTIVIASSGHGTSISNHVTANSEPNVTVLPNPGSEFIENANTIGSHDENINSDVVSRAVRESNLNIQKGADYENEADDENETSATLETLVVEGAENDQLNPVLSYYKNGGKQTGQLVSYYVEGQPYSTVATYEQGESVSVEDQGQMFENNAQVEDNRNSQIGLSLVDFSDKHNADVNETETGCNKEKLQSVSNSEIQLLVNGTNIQANGFVTDSPATEDVPENENVRYVIQEDAGNACTYDTENTDTADPESDTDTDYVGNTVQPGSALTEIDDNNMHIIIENSNDATVQRISIDTLKKTLVASSEAERGEFQGDVAEHKPQTTNDQEDDSVMTTKELYLCGNCSAGFSSIQECKDHMLSDHGQYAEENLAGGPAADSQSNKVDACTQVEQKKKPGRKKKSEMANSPESVKEIISDSDEDWSEKLNVAYSHSNRSRRKRRPPPALKNDYYLGKCLSLQVETLRNVP